MTTTTRSANAAMAATTNETVTTANQALITSTKQFEQHNYDVSIHYPDHSPLRYQSHHHHNLLLV